MLTARQAIVSVLYESDRPLAVFEFGLMGVAQTAISARLRELARDGIVVGVKPKDKPYKVWAMKPAELTLPLTVIA